MKQYLITDPQYYGSEVFEFKENLICSLEKNQVDIACFRDKKSKNFKELAKVFVSVCKEYKIETILISEQYELAHELKATGVHLTSKQFDKIKACKEKDLYTIISCHTIQEIEKAQKKYVDAVTYSPIFNTPNKGEPKGVAKLKKVRDIFDMNIIALGGIISQKQIEKLKNLNIYAFASIRYFL